MVLRFPLLLHLESGVRRSSFAKASTGACRALRMVRRLSSVAPPFAIASRMATAGQAVLVLLPFALRFTCLRPRVFQFKINRDVLVSAAEAKRQFR